MIVYILTPIDQTDNLPDGVKVATVVEGKIIAGSYSKDTKMFYPYGENEGFVISSFLRPLHDVITLTREDAVALRNYFGEHDMTAFEHRMFDLFDNLFKEKK